ncbi:hypothetical protein HYZ98_04390 [Candidatus Peregrinibacteria bacterium]|nr:hypothetical protein [Candidatus Peregrinibacteria bacterium]
MRAVILIILAALVMVGIWMLPALFMGFPIYSPNLDEARLYLDTGVLAYGDGHFSAMVFAYLTRFIAWDNLLGWTFFSAISLAAAVVALWWNLRTLSGACVAWCSIVIFGLMPIYFQQALTLTNYTLSYLFLFLSGGAFLMFFFKQRQVWLLMLSGVFFGICLGLKEAFVLFIPWMAVSYVWTFRKKWKTAMTELFIFLACAGVVVSLPVLPDALGPNKSVFERLATIFSMEQTKPIGEFYPDQYTYDFDKDWYEETVLARRAQENRSFLDRIRGYNRLILFDIGEQSFLFSVFNAIWLFVHQIPALFFVETVGGVMMWLFILPGAVYLFRSNRRVFWFFIGLILTSEFILRFVLHYQRIHLMEYGWVLALMGALGVVQLGQHLERYWPRVPVMYLLMAILSLHLLQMNRLELARLYNRSTVPDRIAVAGVIKELPEESLIAVPTNYKNVAGMTGRDMTIFREETIERLLSNGKLSDAFHHYGVTHVLRYPEELTRQILRADPSVSSLEIPPGKKPEVTPVMNYLLHLFR